MLGGCDGSEIIKHPVTINEPDIQFAEWLAKRRNGTKLVEIFADPDDGRAWCDADRFVPGELRDARTAAKLTRMGTQAGWPDFVLIPPTGAMHCVELKRQGEGLSEAQEAFKFWCVRHGVPYVVAFTMADVLTAFSHWRCLDDDAHALAMCREAMR